MASVIYNFFTQFNNNNNNKKIVQPMGSTRPNSTHVGWVRLMGWTYVMGWVELNFFLPTMVGWVKKSP